MITAEEIVELAKRASKDSLAHGFRDNEHPASRLSVKIACEVAEAVAAARTGKKAVTAGYEQGKRFIQSTRLVRNKVLEVEKVYRDFIKDSIQDEMADVAILLLVQIGHFHLQDESYEHALAILADEDFKDSYAGRLNGDFVHDAGEVMKMVLVVEEPIESMLILKAWFNREFPDEDFWYYVKEKMDYNRTRPYLHGYHYDMTV